MTEKLKDGYILYQPKNHKVLVVDHFEVWVGLPLDLEFYDARARNPRYIGLRAETDQAYAWVDPGAVPIIKADPKTLLLALGKRTSKRMEFYSVFIPSQEDPVAFAKSFAEEKLRSLYRGRGHH